MSKKKDIKHQIDRRAALGLGLTGIVGSQLAMTGLDFAGAMLPEQAMLENIKRILQNGIPKAMAAPGSQVKLMQMTVVDKMPLQEYIFMAAGGTPPPGWDLAGVTADGVDISGMVQSQTMYRGIPMTTFAATMLQNYNLPSDVGIAFINCSGPGGHSLDQEFMEGAEANGSGVLYQFLKHNVDNDGALGSTNFRFDAGANDTGAAAKGVGGVDLPAYTQTGDLLKSLNSLEMAVPAAGSNQHKLASMLNDHVYLAKSRGGQRREDVLQELNKVAKDARPDIVAATLAGSKPFLQQANLIAAAMKHGLSISGHCGFSCGDSNVANWATYTGGPEGYSHWQQAAEYLEAVCTFHQNVDNGYTVSSSDAGRAVNAADNSNGVKVLSGGKINSGHFGPVVALEDVGNTNAMRAQSQADGGYLTNKGNTIDLPNSSQIAGLIYRVTTGEDLEGCEYVVSYAGRPIANLG